MLLTCTRTSKHAEWCTMNKKACKLDLVTAKMVRSSRIPIWIAALSAQLVQPSETVARDNPVRILVTAELCTTVARHDQPHFEWVLLLQDLAKFGLNDCLTLAHVGSALISPVAEREDEGLRKVVFAHLKVSEP